MDDSGFNNNAVPLGCLFLLGLHILAIMVLFIIFGLPGLSGIPGAANMPWRFLLLIGAAQLVYVIPAVLIAWRSRHGDTAFGLIIGAAITLLLNSACWGVFGFRGFPGF
jgi:hypothetical protein